jgi:hypothetical protein
LPLEGWFSEGHGGGTYIWTPPPAAGNVVVGKLGRTRLVRPESMHMVVIPHLMTGWWRRHMARGTDFYFKIDWSNVRELEDQFKPLLIFVCLPYKSCSPNWKEKFLIGRISQELR